MPEPFCVPSLMFRAQSCWEHACALAHRGKHGCMRARRMLGPWGAHRVEPGGLTGPVTTAAARFPQTPHGIQVVESSSVSVTPRIIPRTSCIIVTMAHIRALIFKDRVRARCSCPACPALQPACHVTQLLRTEHRGWLRAAPRLRLAAVAHHPPSHA
jgi:hypothetical protein